MDEDLQERYFVFDGFEKGVEAQVITEGDPLVPHADGGAGATRTDSLGDCFRNSAEMIAEAKAGGGVHT